MVSLAVLKLRRMRSVRQFVKDWWAYRAPDNAYIPSHISTSSWCIEQVVARVLLLLFSSALSGLLLTQAAPTWTPKYKLVKRRTPISEWLREPRIFDQISSLGPRSFMCVCVSTAVAIDRQIGKGDPVRHIQNPSSFVNAKRVPSILITCWTSRRCISDTGTGRCCWNRSSPWRSITYPHFPA